jgi:hypothetical protein
MWVDGMEMFRDGDGDSGYGGSGGDATTSVPITDDADPDGGTAGEGGTVGDAFVGRDGSIPTDDSGGADGGIRPDPVTQVFSITHGADDAEELVEEGGRPYPVGYTYHDSTDLEFALDDWFPAYQIVAMRFTSVTIPANATITDAYVRFTVDSAGSGPTDLTISGEATGNALRFTTQQYDISTRQQTLARVGWGNLSAWSPGQQHDTPDISTIIEEIVKGSGWASGNALVLFVRGTGDRTAEAYDGDRAGSPRLHITHIEAR